MPTIKVRRAGPADAEAVVGLLRRMHDEAPAGALDIGRVRATVADCLANGWVFVSEQSGMLGGTMALRCSQWWWSSDWHLGDQWLFVHPEHRRAPHARLLLRRARALAQEHAVPLVVGLFSDRRLPGKIGMMQRELGAPSGAVFLLLPAGVGVNRGKG